jgi:hypothetical protein
MYKSIIKWIIALVIRPNKAWTILNKKKSKSDDILGKFIYPIIGVLTLTAFIGVLITHKVADVQMALKSAISVLSASFGGYYLAVFILNEFSEKLFKREKDIKLWQQFIGYSSSVMFALNAILILIPEFFFLRICVLYTFYIIWEGAPIYMQVEEKDQLKFTGITTGIILFAPYMIEYLLYFLMPGLRI